MINEKSTLNSIDYSTVNQTDRNERYIPNNNEKDKVGDRITKDLLINKDDEGMRESQACKCSLCYYTS